MKTFLVDGRVHAYEDDGSQDRYIPNGARQITEQQAVEILNPGPTPEDIQAAYTAALDAHLESTVKSRGFDNRVTCTMRAGYPGPFQADGAAFGQWMDACYLAGRKVMADVMAGTRQIPTTEAFLAELPPMVWPEGSL